MLTDERIREASGNIKNYLKEGLLKKVEPKEGMIRILMNNSEESLEELDRIRSPLWRIVVSYYSMFYISNAVLLKNRYKVGDRIAHKITADALIVFIRHRLKEEILESYEDVGKDALEGIRADEMIESFDLERRKRGIFQYTTTEKAKESKAKTSEKRAKEFIFEMKRLL